MDKWNRLREYIKGRISPYLDCGIRVSEGAQRMRAILDEMDLIEREEKEIVVVPPGTIVGHQMLSKTTGGMNTTIGEKPGAANDEAFGVYKNTGIKDKAGKVEKARPPEIGCNVPTPEQQKSWTAIGDKALTDCGVDSSHKNSGLGGRVLNLGGVEKAEKEKP